MNVVRSFQHSAFHFQLYPITLLSVPFLTWYPLGPMTVSEFICKWSKVELKERSAAQEHFLDLCSVFDHPTPAAADPTGESFCFENSF